MTERERTATVPDEWPYADEPTACAACGSHDDRYAVVDSLGLVWGGATDGGLAPTASRSGRCANSPLGATPSANTSGLRTRRSRTRWRRGAGSDPTAGDRREGSKKPPARFAAPKRVNRIYLLGVQQLDA